MHTLVIILLFCCKFFIVFFITVIETITATACITAEHGSFNHIRQVAPICIPSNKWFFWTSPKRHLDQFNFFAGHIRVTNTHTDRQTDRHIHRPYYIESCAGIDHYLALVISQPYYVHYITICVRRHSQFRATGFS